MPVIVVGADTPLGEATIAALLPREGEVRAFVTSPAAAAALKVRGVKVALGDVSDGSHVGGAAMRVFCAVLISTAASDDRERSFAADRSGVLRAWVHGMNDAKVSRVIAVADSIDDVAALTGLKPQLAVVHGADRDILEVAREIARLEDAATLPER